MALWGMKAMSRQRMARFIGAERAEEIVFVRNTTEALNLVAVCWGRANLKPGDEILATLLEHHSNLIPWQRVAQETGAKIRLIGLTPDRMKQGMPRAIMADAIASLIMAFVLAHAIVYAQAVTLGQGAVVGFFNWLGFVAVVQFTGVLYERRPIKLFFLQSGFNLIAMALMGMVLAVWR